jgi:transcription factor 1
MRLAGVSEWDFVLRALFMNKSTPISQSLKCVYFSTREIILKHYRSMAPGAQNMVKYMDQSTLAILDKAPIDLTMADWAGILEAFQRWPFHPTV